MKDNLYTLILIEGQEKQSIEALENQRLIDLIRKIKSDFIESPCGGNGSCGKCKFKLLSGYLTKPKTMEQKLLSDQELKDNIRLACFCNIESDLTIAKIFETHAKILTDGPRAIISIDPIVKAYKIELEMPSLENPVSIEENLKKCLENFFDKAIPIIDLHALQDLARASISSRELKIVSSKEKIFGVKTFEAKSQNLGAAIDLGTTTIALQLLDLDSGEVLSSYSELNCQRSFGSDVISRISYCENNKEGLSTLSSIISVQLNKMLELACLKASSIMEDINLISIAGNTTMLHILLGLRPDTISRSPFTTITLNSLIERSKTLGLVRHNSSAVVLIPGISAYVGSDIVIGAYSVNLIEQKGISLFLDIGTNGEILLASDSNILSCSTAAGPAFEGGGIEMGILGQAGAIDYVRFDGEDLFYTTIDNKTANGICGSGLVSALAALLDSKLIDETGRIRPTDELSLLSPRLKSRVKSCGNNLRIYLDNEERVYLSQSDIRAAQLAKAAIYSGLICLIKRAQVSIEDIDRIFLAGGFGSFLDIEGAIRIGLLPKTLIGKVIVVNNTSLSGACMTCLSWKSLEACNKIIERANYIELSAYNNFNDIYIDSILFPNS